MKKKGDSLAGILIGMGGGVNPLFCAVNFRLHDHRAVIFAEAVPCRGNDGPVCVGLENETRRYFRGGTYNG